MPVFKTGRMEILSEILTYRIADRLYLNITNRCTNRCVFCIRDTKEGVGYHLWLQREPSAAQVIEAAGDIRGYSEIVFCGYGEPLLRYDLVREVAKELKSRGAVVRINTNGQASLLHQQDVARGLCGLVDTINISLNAHSPEKYMELCRPAPGEKAYPALLDFAWECKKYIPRVVLSVVDWPGVDIDKCREIANTLGVEFRLRTYSG